MGKKGAFRKKHLFSPNSQGDSMKLIDTILQKMSSISIPQRKFLVTLLITIQLLRGKMTFRNVSRSSTLHEKTYSRHVRQCVDWADVNHVALTTLLPAKTTKIAAIDCTVTSKSGKRTDGLDLFYDASHKTPKRCLEFSEMAVVDVDYGTAYHLSMEHTPPAASLSRLFGQEGTRIDWYGWHLRQTRALLPPEVQYLAADGAYAKQKFVDGVCEFAFHLVSKLRHDANLRYRYAGPHPTRRGARQKYDGKVNFTDLSRLTPLPLSDDLTLYTAVVNSVSLRRDLRLVYVCKRPRHGTKLLTALLFSTDIALAAEDIYRFDTSRFQIEFLFRDAKQLTGLADFQVRSQRRIAFHVNASLTALNVLTLEDRMTAQDETSHVISISRWKTRKFNAHQLERIISTLGLDLSSIKLHPDYENLINYGAIAA
jgi:hypothetical protein